MAKILKRKPLKIVDVVAKEPKIDYVAHIRELRMIGMQMSELKKRDEKIKTILNPYIDKNVTADGKGHRFYETTDDLGERLILKREARKSRKLNEEKAREFFVELGVDERVITSVTVEKFDEAEIENLIAEGVMTVKDLETISDEKVTYATTFVKNTEVEEEENPNG